MKAEFARLDARSQFRIESAAAERAVFAARGRQVVVEPPRGFCLAPDSLSVNGGAAFALVGDCPGAARPFPGILTVSVSDRSMAESRKGTGAALVDLQAFLTTPQGLALLGRGEGGGQVRVLETRQLGDALYVLVEDGAPGALPILAPRFWRAFVDVNDRMVLSTISGFRDVEIENDVLLGHLARQVVQLREANLAPLFDDEVRVARSVDGDLVVAAGAVTRAEPVLTPIPPSRPAAAAPQTETETETETEAATETASDAPAAEPALALAEAAAVATVDKETGAEIATLADTPPAPSAIGGGDLVLAIAPSLSNGAPLVLAGPGPDIASGPSAPARAPWAPKRPRRS